MSRKSSRITPNATFSQRIKSLFHQHDIEPILKSNITKIHKNPNIYWIDDFLSSTEITWFDRICTQYSNQFKSSFTENENNEEIISEERTSTYIHLSKSQDRVVRNVEQKAAELVGMTSDYVEPLQIVSYTDNQQFSDHHDAGTLLDDGNVVLVLPRRIITLFLYLNTLPNGQGHTEFPHPRISITPKRGSGILFCNLFEDGYPDPRLVHRATPVHHELIKYGINIWITDTSCQDLASIPGTNKVNTKLRYDPHTSAFARANQLTEEYLSNRERTRQQHIENMSNDDNDDQLNVNENQHELHQNDLKLTQRSVLEKKDVFGIPLSSDLNSKYHSDDNFTIKKLKISDNNSRKRNHDIITVYNTANLDNDNLSL